MKSDDFHYELVKDDYIVSIRKNYDGKNKNWVVTSFKLKDPAKKKPTATDTLSSPNGVQSGRDVATNEVSAGKGSTSSNTAQGKGGKKKKYNTAKKVAAAVAKAIGIEKFVGKDELRPSTHGVYYMGGYAYATDGQKMIKMRVDYPKEYEGKSINPKDGTEYKGPFLNFASILDPYNHDPQEHVIDGGVFKTALQAMKSMPKGVTLKRLAKEGIDISVLVADRGLLRDTYTQKVVHIAADKVEDICRILDNVKGAEVFLRKYAVHIKGDGVEYLAQGVTDHIGGNKQSIEITDNGEVRLNAEWDYTQTLKDAKERLEALTERGDAKAIKKAEEDVALYEFLVDAQKRWTESEDVKEYLAAVEEKENPNRELTPEDVKWENHDSGINKDLYEDTFGQVLDKTRADNLTAQEVDERLAAAESRFAKLAKGEKFALDNEDKRDELTKLAAEIIAYKAYLKETTRGTRIDTPTHERVMALVGEYIPEELRKKVAERLREEDNWGRQNSLEDHIGVAYNQTYEEAYLGCIKAYEGNGGDIALYESLYNQHKEWAIEKAKEIAKRDARIVVVDDELVREVARCEALADLIKRGKAAKGKGNGGVLFRFADSKGDLDQLRNEAAERKGIVMPNLKDKMLNVLGLQAHDFKAEDGMSILKAALEWAKQNIAKTCTLTDSVGKQIECAISNATIKESLNKVSKSSNIDAHLSVLKSLPQVLENSIEVELHPDYNKVDGVRKPENGHTERTIIHRYQGSVEIGGKTYRVKTTIKEFRPTDDSGEK